MVFFPKGNYKLRQITIPSDITLFAYKGKISNYAEPRLFYLENVSNVRIQGFEITAYTGNEWAQTVVYMHDICSYIHLEDLWCIDHNRNHAIQYADNDDDGGLHARSFFFNITLKDIKITGSSSIQNSAGINLFPRKQNSNRPEAKNLFIDNLFIDISNNSNNVTEQGNSGLKINNTDGVFINNIKIIGGNISAVGITNGCRNIHMSNIHTRKCDVGIGINGIDADSGAIIGDIWGVHISNWSHENKNAIGSDYSLMVRGDADSVTICNALVDKDISIDAKSIYTIQNVNFENVLCQNEAKISISNDCIIFQPFRDQDTTPSVASGHKFKTVNSLATMITNFKEAYNG